MMRRLNLVFLAVLLVVVAVIGGGMYLVHGFQIQRNASALLDRARRAEAGNNLEKAEHSLREYLNIRREDGPAWEWYARVVDQKRSGRLDRVFLVHEEALRNNPGNVKLERRCTDLALELGRYNDAQRHLSTLLEQLTKDTRGQRAELEDLLGQCERGSTRYVQAEKWFVEALKHDPGRVACYDRLARLRRNELRLNGAADGTIKEMVAKNPKSGVAYVYRWRYSKEFLPSALPSDLQEALKLAPDDPEVLITAALVSEQKPDAAAARMYYEKGCKLDPKNSAFAIGLARLELREKHPAQAETVLRRAFQAKPSLSLAFELAETLIYEDKVEGKDGAADYMALLRNAGLGDTVVRFLEAEIPIQKKDWLGAIPRIESARAALRSDPRLTARLNLMLAECYGRVGSQEQRLVALRQAAENEAAPDEARVDLAQALLRSGKLDQGLTNLTSLAERRPELRLDIARLLIQKTQRQPRDKRNWLAAEQAVKQAEKARPEAVESLTLLRADLLEAKERGDEARALIASAQAKNPRSLEYRLALAGLAGRMGKGPLSLQILDEAEKDLGPSPWIALARLSHWSERGGDEAKTAVAKVAETFSKLPADAQPGLLEQLANAEIRLGEPALAQQHLGELLKLQPANLEVLMRLFDLAMQAADWTGSNDLVARIRKIEGEDGTHWRFAQATLLIAQARRAKNTARELTRADIEVMRALASEIGDRRPDWWAGPLLLAEIAEFEGRYDDVVAGYLRSIHLGNVQPAIVRYVIGLLSDRRRFADIDRLVTKLRDTGIASEDLAIATAFSAIRKKDYERGLALARQVIPAKSTRYSDHLTLGRILMTSGKVEEAGKEFRQALDLAPSVPETWLAWVEYLARTNQAQSAREAAAAAEKALSSVGSPLTIAQCYWSAGEASKAEAAFRQAIKDRPHDAASLRSAASFFLDQNRVDQAAPLLAELLKPETKASQADVTWATRSKMMLGFASGVKPEHREQALRLVEQDLKSDPDDFDAQRMRAVLLSMQFSRRKESIQALESMDRAQELAPRERFLLATLYSAERDWPKCKSQMQRILEDRAPQPQHLIFYVRLMTRLGELDEAERWFRTLKPLVPSVQTGVALELESGLLKARKQDLQLAALIRSFVDRNPDQVRLGAVLLERFGLPKEAEPAFRVYVAGNPNEPERVLDLIEFLSRQDRPQEALELCELAMKTCRPEAVTLASLGIYDAKSATESQRKKVEAWLRETVRQKPDLVVLKTKLATLLTRKGSYTEAEKIYRELLRANQDNVEALNNLAWQLALRNQDSNEALTLVERAIDIAGPIPALLDTRALVRMQLSQGARALADIRESLSSDPDKPVRYFHLARAYNMTSAHAEARKALERSQALGLKEETVDPLERQIYRKLHHDISLR